MSPCTSGGYMDPRTGHCNCDQSFVSEVDKKINHAKHKAKKVLVHEPFNRSQTLAEEQKSTEYDS